MLVRRVALWFLGLILVIGIVASTTLAISSRFSLQVPPASSSITVVRPSPDVLVAVRALARLESVCYHMERIIDLTDKQSRLFGLIESEDALLLVAIANVTAGVDLQKLQASAIDVDPDAHRVHVVLPAPEILSSALDSSSTYVHTRKTGILAQRKEDLETRARAEAERTLVEAARQAGILDAASRNAERAVEALLRSLGFAQVEVVSVPTPKDGIGLH